MMVAYSFRPRFVPMIEQGMKLQTIRQPRGGHNLGRHAYPGERLQLYTGMRTKHCRLIRETVCTVVLPIRVFEQRLAALDVSEELQEKIRSAFDESQRLAGLNISAPFDLAAIAAERLAGAANAAFAAMQQMQNASISGLRESEIRLENFGDPDAARAPQRRVAVAPGWRPVPAIRRCQRHRRRLVGRRPEGWPLMPWPPRLSDWHRRLAAYLAAAGHHPFQEGTHDCALFVGGGVAAMTGADPMAELRGRYATTAEGLALLRTMGVADHLDWYGRRFPRLRQGERLRPGDIACLPGHDGPSLGIVQGEAVYVLRLDAGLALAPLSDVLRGWRVG